MEQEPKILEIADNPDQEIDLSKILEDRRMIIEQLLYHEGLGKPIYAELDNQRQISIKNIDHAQDGSSQRIEINERNILNRKLVGIALTTGDPEYPYIVLELDSLGQFVIKLPHPLESTVYQQIRNTADRWFDPINGVGYLINSEKSIEQHMRSYSTSLGIKIISDKENPSLVEEKAKQAVEITREESKRRMEERLKLAKKINDIFANLIHSNST